MAAGLATLAVIEDEQLVANAERTGELLQDALQDMVGRVRAARRRARPRADDRHRVRQASLAEAAGRLEHAAGGPHGLFAQMVVVALFQRHRILTQVSGDYMDVIKLLPPLTIGETEVERSSRPSTTS